jgi:hypothetical protein
VYPCDNESNKPNKSLQTKLIVLQDMHTLLTTLLGISFLMVLLGCIPYGIWLIRTVFKKQWKKLGLQIGVPIIWFALLLGATKIFDSYAHDQYFNDLYDVDVNLGSPVFESDSDRSFNGDGCSISIYELPSEIRARFESPDKNLLSEFPKRPHYRNNWSVKTWKEAPFNEEFEQYLDFALCGASGRSSEIREVLSRKGTYYAFFHSDHGDNVGNIDFFIVDLVGGLLYSINVNT